MTMLFCGIGSRPYVELALTHMALSAFGFNIPTSMILYSRLQPASLPMSYYDMTTSCSL